MALFKNNKLHPWFHHGGELELDTLMKQVLDIKITFPHTAVSGGYNCRPVTINLGRELGVSSYSSVYAVNWENSDKTTTVKDSMSSYKHEHTFNNPGTVTDFTKTFRIILYGDPLLPVHNHVYQSGSGDNAFKVETTVIETPFTRMLPNLFDSTIRRGARITRAYHGGYLVYGKKFAGTTYNVQIKLTGNSNTVRLVNPLLEQYCTNWNNRKNDIRVNWGDGHEDFIVNRKIDTGIHNTDSNIKVEHQYLKGKAGDIFNLTITSVEPVLPIGCEVIKLNGSLPEDTYTRDIKDSNARYGFLKYTDSEITKYEFRRELTKHRSTIVDIGDSLLDNWLNVNNMDHAFRDWIKLTDIKKGLFKDNILKNVKSYISTFHNTPALKTVDPLLIGNTNDIIFDISNMFEGSGVTNALDLVNAPNLSRVNYTYCGTKVNNVNNFLHNAPKVLSAIATFSGSTIQNISDKFLSNSTLLEDIHLIFENTNMNDIKFNFHNYPKLHNLARSYFNSKIPKLRADLFGGNFAKDVANNKINMSEMFASIKLPAGLIIDPLAFTSLGTKADKINDDGFVGLLTETIVKSIPADMFKGVLKSNTPRFNISNIFNGMSSTDAISQIGLRNKVFKGMYLPSIFKECNGIKSGIQMLANTIIGDMDDNFIYDMVNLQDIRSIMYRTTIMFKRLSNIFNKNTNIVTWTNAFDSMKVSDIYDDYPMNRFINTKADRINITGLFANPDNRISIYRMFTKDTTITAVNDDGLSIKNLNPSVPDTVIYGNIKHNATFNPTIKPIIFTIVVTAENTNVSFIQYNNAEANMDVKYDIYGSYTTVNANHSKNFTKGVHHISVKCSNSVKLVGNGFDVIRISGEYPYNSKLDFEHCEHYKLREIDRYVFSVCDHNDLHKKDWFRTYIPILHKDIFEFHDDVTKTNFFIRNGIYSSMYGMQPFMLDKMYKLNDLSNTFTSEMRVLTSHHIPKNITLTNKTPRITDTNVGRLHIVGDIKNGVMTNFTTGTTQIVRTKGQELAGTRSRTEYLEMRLSAFTGQIKLSQLVNDTIFPITVEVFSINGSEPSRAIINDFNTGININGESLVRIYSSKAVWIDQKDKIVELFGTIPAVNLNKTFLELAPNLRRIGEDLLINITNTSVRALFKGLKMFEYFPGTLFWNLPNVLDYYECFADCPKLTKVDDYIVTAKVGNKINCSRMFANSGIKNARYPIMSDIINKVDVTDMFIGCTTDVIDSTDNLDLEMFRNIDIVGNSKIGKGTVREPINYPFIFVELNSNSIEGLKNSYYIPEATLRGISDPNGLIWASQSIPEQVLYVDRTKFSPDSVKYLPFVCREVSVNRGNVTRGYYDYMERLINISNLSGISGGMFNRTNNIKDMNSLYMNLTLNNVDICHLFPSNCGSLMCCANMMENTKGIVIRNGWKIPKNIITDFLQMMKGTDVNVPVGMFDNREIDFIPDNMVMITEIFKNNTGNTTEVGIFKAYGNKLRTDITNVYANNINLVNLPVDALAKCTELESVAYFFSNCVKLRTLPTINHLTKCRNYVHFMDKTAIESVPENYIYTTRTDFDIMIDYMFADCPLLFLENKFVDPRCKGYFSIDYSLNDVLTSVGEDPELFGDVRYDTEYEHRSRVTLFDKRIGWVQNIKTNKDNANVTVKSVQRPDLVGLTSNSVISILWGDDSRPVVVRPGNPIRTEHITHTYKKAGTYEFKVMISDHTAYLETLTDDVWTIGLPATIKFGEIEGIKAKGLSNMFGNHVQTITPELFNEVTGANTVTVYQGMFKGFNHLADLPVGILDVFTNIRDLSDFMAYTYTAGSPRITLKDGLLDKLTNLTTIDRFGLESNIENVDLTMFKRGVHSNIRSAISFLENAPIKLSEFPGTVFGALSGLENATAILANNKFLDDNNVGFRFSNKFNFLFLNNSKLKIVDYALACPIDNMVNCYTIITQSMVSANFMFASSHEITKDMLPLDKPEYQKYIITEKNTYTLPANIFSITPNMKSMVGMFAGRKSLIGYDRVAFYQASPTIVDYYGMLCQTGITEIKAGTIVNKTSNVDVRYMFYGCNIPNLIEKPITNSTGTFKTYGMLKGTRGTMTEAEVFDGVKTDPTDIQSMYRQSRDWFIIELENVVPGDYYIVPMRSDSQYGPDVGVHGNGYNLEVNWGDGSPLMIIDQDIKTWDEMKRLSTHKIAKAYTKLVVKISYPMAVCIKFNENIEPNVVKLTGAMGVMYGGKYDYHYPQQGMYEHFSFLNENFHSESGIIIEGENFFKYIVADSKFSPYEMFKNAEQLYKLGTTVFKAFETKTWDVLESIVTMCDKLVFDKEGGYEPDLSKIKSKKWISVFSNCPLVKPSADWEPFKDQNYSVEYRSILSGTKLNRTLMLSLTPDPVNVLIEGCFSGLNLDEVRIPFANNLSNKPYISFDSCFNFTTIKNIVTEHALLDEVNTSSKFSLSCRFMFNVSRVANTDTGSTPPSLSRKDILDKILGDMKILDGHDDISIVDMTYMFGGQDVRGKEKSTREFELNFRNAKSIRLDNMFKNTYMDGIGNNSVKGSKGSIESFDYMFEKCYAKPNVVHPKDVFNMVDINSEKRLDARKTELNTLNYFKINVTPNGEPLKYKLKYVGGPVINNARYIHLVNKTIDNKFFTETIADVQSKVFTSDTTQQDIIIESVPFIVVEILSNVTLNSVTGHLSTHDDNWVDWKDKFSFGQYYGNARSFDIRLGGQFYVKDGAFCTLNGLFKGMKYITSYREDLFADYFDGSLGTTNSNVVGLVETFADNPSLTEIKPGMLQYLPYLESIRMAWMNTSISYIHPSTFANNNNIRDTYKAFANTKIPKLDSNIIAINNK